MIKINCFTRKNELHQGLGVTVKEFDTKSRMKIIFDRAAGILSEKIERLGGLPVLSFPCKSAHGGRTLNLR